MYSVHCSLTLWSMNCMGHVVGSLEKPAIAHAHKTSRDWKKERSAHAHKTSVLFFRKELRQVWHCGARTGPRGWILGQVCACACTHLSYSVFQERTATSLALWCTSCMATWLDPRKSLRMRLNLLFCISGKNWDKFGIVVHELGHVVGF